MIYSKAALTDGLCPEIKPDVSAQALVKNLGKMGVRGGVRPHAHPFFRLFSPGLSSYNLTAKIPASWNIKMLPGSLEINGV